MRAAVIATAMTLASVARAERIEVFKLAAQREELQTLRQERDALQAREARQWFLLGASVLGAGIVLGLVLPRLRWRRKRNDWGSW